MSFEILVDGEVVWSTDEKVLRVSARTAQGEAAEMKVENLDHINLATEVRTSYNMPLSLVEERQAEERENNKARGGTEAKDGKVDKKEGAAPTEGTAETQTESNEPVVEETPAETAPDEGATTETAPEFSFDTPADEKKK